MPDKGRLIVGFAVVVILVSSGCAGAGKSISEGDGDPVPADAMADTTAEMAQDRDTVATQVPRYIPRRSSQSRDERTDSDGMEESRHMVPLPFGTDVFDAPFAIPSDEWPFEIGHGIASFPGCTGGVVSPHGLLVTSRSCLLKFLGSEAPVPAEGFRASSSGEERRLEELTIEVVVEVLDVSVAVNDRISGGQEAGEAVGDVRDSLEAGRPGVVVDAWWSEGGVAAIVRKRYGDVRLVFTPHEDVADFGGEFDAGSYPQYKLDVALARLYDQGRPASTPWHLGWRTDHVADDSPVFLIGATPSSENGRSEANNRLGPLWISAGEIAPAPATGTTLSSHVSFFGMYDRYHAFAGEPTWQLPPEWTAAADALPLSVPITIAATNAVVEGMLGGPLLDSSRRVRGLVYDTNHEMAGLQPEEIRPHRVVVLSAAGLTHALISIYGAQVVARELESGTMAGAE